MSWKLLWGGSESDSRSWLQALIGRRTVANAETLSLLGLLWESLGRSFTRAWLVLGVLGTLMPDLIAIVQHRYPALAHVLWITWVCDNQSEIRVSIAAIVVFSYLIYAPYRIQKDKIQLLQSRLAELVEDKTKGLKVSIEANVDPLINIIGGIVTTTQTQLYARLTFINDGHILRTVLGVEFVYLDPDRTFDKTYQLLGATRYEDRKDTSATAPLPISPGGAEIVASYRLFIDPETYEKDKAEFGLSIDASDGRGGPSYQKIIMALTVSRPANGSVSYAGKRLVNVSLDKD